jgi:Adenylate and Guanylate cyclase catalytic domain
VPGTRKLAAILAADVVGYSKLAGADEDRTLARLRGLRSDLIDPAIAAHHGRIVKRTGDGAIVEFRSVVDAVRCAIEVQNGMVERNAGLPPERRIEFRIGIHLGDVVEESDGDLMGDGVNIAARLEGVADPGGICLSEDAYRQVRDRPMQSGDAEAVPTLVLQRPPSWPSPVPPTPPCRSVQKPKRENSADLGCVDCPGFFSMASVPFALVYLATSRNVERRLSYSPATRHRESPRTSASCRSCCARRRR